MASLEDHCKANGVRLSRLLVDKGTEAMRNVFDSIHPPATLTATLTSYRSFLQRLRFISQSQFNILFPPSGVPSKSTDFDITLLFVLLRNICALHPPTSTSSWDVNPPPTDMSREANLARIKYYRNVVYGHVVDTGVDDANFSFYWKEISTALTGLGVNVGDIEVLRTAPLEENCYLNQVKEWKEKEDKLEVILQKDCAKQEAILEIQKETSVKLETLTEKLNKIEETLKPDQNGENPVRYIDEKKTRKQGFLEKFRQWFTFKGSWQDDNGGCDLLQHLVRCDFRGDIRKLNKSFHPGTRDWLLWKLNDWLLDKDSDSRVMVLTAGPGVGKSVFAAKVCQEYAEKGQLAACHFCRFNYSDYRDPQKMLQSLAINMCEKVDGFKEELLEQLRRDHSRTTVTDAFRVLLKDPLNSLPDQEPMVIVIDALDESETGGKSELLDLIADEFSGLPTWIKIFITSRPELPVQKKLSHLNAVEIRPDNEDNKEDLKCFLESCLGNVGVEYGSIGQLVERCEGSFLYAYHCQLELLRLKKAGKLRADKRFVDVMPQSIGVYYEKYFKRLEEELKKLSPNIDLGRILEVLVAMKGPLPLSFVAEILELPRDTSAMKEVICKVNNSLSALLLVYDDCLTIFHKTVVDWLVLSKEYKRHRFVVSCEAFSGHKHLWQVCRGNFVELEWNGTNEPKTVAQEYALDHGADHLKQVTYHPPVVSVREKSFSRDMTIPVIWFQQRGKQIPCGYGWLLSQDNENAYVMTTSQVLRHIKHHEINTPRAGQTVIIEFRVRNGIVPTYHSIPVPVESDFVAVSSNENSVLDYAILTWKSNVVLGKPFKISKGYYSPGDVVYTPDPEKCFGSKYPGIMAKYPEDLISWLKVRTSSNLRNIAKGIPVLSCNRSIVWDEVEEQKEALIHHYPNKLLEYPFGLPLIDEQDEIVGLCSFSVCLNVGTGKRPFTCFSVSMDKIVKDVNSKKPDLARRLFPSLFL